MQQPGRTLKSVRIFESLPEEELEALARRFQWKRFNAGRQIISHLENSTDLFLVLEGAVRVTVYSHDGKEVTFRDIEAGEYFGELSAIDGSPRSATVTALKSSLLACVSADTFWEILRQYPEVSALVMKSLAASVRALTERVFEFSALAVRNRVHAELLRLAQQHKLDDKRATITPAPTHAELASRISTHREAVTRELNHLSRKGILKRKAGALEIYDVEALACLVQDLTGD